MTIVVDDDDEDKIERAKGAVPLALHAMFRPTSREEPVQQDDILSLQKLFGEGALAELKIVSGWLLDLQKFLIKLPTEKAQGWILKIDKMIQKAKNNEMVTKKELESLLRKLNHSSYILREGRYFLFRLRDRL